MPDGAISMKYMFFSYCVMIFNSFERFCPNKKSPCGHGKTCFLGETKIHSGGGEGLSETHSRGVQVNKNHSTHLSALAAPPKVGFKGGGMESV